MVFKINPSLSFRGFVLRLSQRNRILAQTGFGIKRTWRGRTQSDPQDGVVMLKKKGWRTQSPYLEGFRLLFSFLRGRVFP